MLLWSITEEDVVRGLRERDLPITYIEDLTGYERELIRQHLDMEFDYAARKFLDTLVIRLRHHRGLGGFGRRRG